MIWWLRLRILGKIKIDTRIIRNRVAWVLGGIVVIIVGSVLTFGTSTKTLVNTESIRSDLGEVGKTVAGAKKETSNDPRKELANIGIAWDEKIFAPLSIAVIPRLSICFLPEACAGNCIMPKPHYWKIAKKR